MLFKIMKEKNEKSDKTRKKCGYEGERAMRYSTQKRRLGKAVGGA